MDRTWTQELTEQLSWHWENHVRPHLDGLTDDEYLWEPAPGCWNLRPEGETTAPIAAGRGDLLMDWEYPNPVPPPFTTIAWRLGHVIVGVFGMRNAAHFGGPPIDYMSVVWPPTARDALGELDRVYDAWMDGVAALDDDALDRAVGPSEPAIPDAPFRALVLHINREAIHHLAEVLLLRDLYRATHGG